MQNIRTMLAPVRKVINSYNNCLRINYPKLHDLQTVIVHGTKTTMTEGKDYVFATANYLRGRPLTYKDVALRWQYPRDVLKLTPVMAIMVLPFSTFLLLPLVYVWPAMFTRHFWTAEESQKFTARQVRRRLSVVPDIIHDFDKNIQKVENVYEHGLLRHVIKHVKDGRIISSPDLRALEPIFARYPFHLENLSSDYVWNLAWLNFVFPWRMEQFTRQLAEMDKMLREDGVESLTERDMRQAAIIRCGNPNADIRDVGEFLDMWTNASATVSGETFFFYTGTQITDQ